MQSVPYWNWKLFAVLFTIQMTIQIVRWIRRDGARNLLRSMRLWGEGVSAKQRRDNLAGLGILLSLLFLGVLFWKID